MYFNISSIIYAFRAIETGLVDFTETNSDGKKLLEITYAIKATWLFWRWICDEQIWVSKSLNGGLVD